MMSARRILLMMVFYAIIGAATGWAAVLHVPAGYATIQEAITESMNGDTVLVSDGTYSGGIDFNGKAITLRSEHGPSTTIIQGDSTDTPAIKLINGEGRNSIIRGFTIRGNHTQNGIYCQNASPTIYKNIIQDNQINIMVETGGPLIRNNDISGSLHHFYGGAIYVKYGTNVVIDSNIIHDNHGDAGGALFAKICDGLTIQRNLIYANTSYYIGALDIDSCINADISNNTITENQSSQYTYGAVSLIWLSGARIYNNIIAYNTEYGLFNDNAGDSAIITYNDIYSNSPGGSLGFTLGEGNLEADPQFASLDSNIFDLLPTSPCIDSGDPTSPIDLDWTVADMGAKPYFHNFTVYIPGDINGDDNRVGADVTYGVRYFKGAGPQPPDSLFNDSTLTWLYAAADVNGNCEFRGSDITYLVGYFKSTNRFLRWCPFTPPF